MHILQALTTLLLLLSPTHASRPKNAILLSQVRTLTLRSSSQTTHRRVSAIPQLRCVSPASICALHRIDVMRCTNQGSAYGPEDIQWACKAELPEELTLGSTEVICEGYDSPNDPYILKGSCGVEYRLVLTEKGERRYPEVARRSGGGWTEGWDWMSYLWAAAFVGFAAWILYAACFGAGADGQRPNDARRRRGYWPGGDGPGGWGGPGWGPGGGGDHDPPPPYPGHKPYGSGNAGQWQPGFWTGLASGAAATYLATGGNNRRDQRRYGGGGWSRGESSTAPSYGSSSSFASGSGRTRESTGFGSTSRR